MVTSKKTGQSSIRVNSKSDKNPPHGKNPSNKGVKLKINSNDIAETYYEHNIHVLKPIIDRIVLRYDPFKGWDKTKIRNFKTFVSSYVEDHDKAGDWDYEHVSSSEKNKNKSLYSSYYKNLWLKHKPSGQNILVQIDSVFPSTPFFRFDFNPSRLGAKGVMFFKQELDFLFCKPEFGIGYEDILKAPKAIDRLDVAVDILGVDVSDLEIKYNPHGNQIVPLKSMAYSSDIGRTQTVYPNANSKGDNETYVYNKKYDLLDKNQKLYYGDALHTRFEHRYTGWGKPLSHLLKMGVGTNPLKKVEILWIDYKQIEGKSFEHVLYLQYARLRGNKKANELIPEYDQLKFIRTYNNAMTNVWYPDIIWEYWPEVVKAYGLLDGL